MATVKHQFKPGEAIPLATAFPQYIKEDGNSFPVEGLSYDATTDEAAFWNFKASNYGSGNLTLVIRWKSATATSGDVVWEAQIAAVTPDTDAAALLVKALATLNYVADTQLGTTAGREQTCTITISNLDSLAADDEVWLRLARDANGTNATDNMTGDAIVTALEIQYSDT